MTQIAPYRKGLFATGFQVNILVMSDEGIRNMAFRHRFVIAACARWETPYALEWLSYHRALGFDHVYLYCNDDDPAELYEAVLPYILGPDPFVTFRHWPAQGEHRNMMLHFLAHDRDSAEWISFLDLDEFLRLPAGVTLPDFMREFAETTDSLLFNWVFFGPNGHKTHPGTPVLSTYTRREAHLHPFTKYLARSAAFTAPGLFERCLDNSFVHRLDEYTTQPLRSRNVLGEDVTRYYEGFPDTSTEFLRADGREARIFATALIHHYAFRSEKAFTDRVARGLKGNFGGEKIWGDLAANEDHLRGFINTVNGVEDWALAAFREHLLQRAQATTVALPGTAAGGRVLLSYGKPCLQSSVSEWSYRPTRSSDAAGAVNGVRNGVRKFHTALETDPWWQVDLDNIATIREIRVHNTTETDDLAARFADFTLSVSIDGENWVELVRKQDAQPVRGAYIWAGPGTAWARFLRVTLLGRNFLHLAQVEVFGSLP